MYDRDSGIIHTVMDCTSNLRKTISLSIRFTANKKTNKTIYFRIPIYKYVMRVGTKYRFLDYTSTLETQSNLFIHEFSHSFLVEYKIRSLRGIHFQRSITIYNNAKNWRKKGAAFSAICFGIYHWFSYGLFGSFIPMILIFLATGFTGLVWAYAFQKTKSMLLPIGLHLGWNFTLNQIFSKGPLGNQLFIPVKGFDYVQLVGIPSLFHFLLPNIAVPLFTYLFIKFYICKTQTKSIASTQK